MTRLISKSVSASRWEGRTTLCGDDRWAVSRLHSVRIIGKLTNVLDNRDDLAGRVWIFPKDYTNVCNARTQTATGTFGTPLQLLTVENRAFGAVVDNRAAMVATMTDIQAAIHRAARKPNDDGWSMSFASTRDDRGGELGHDLDDHDHDHDHGGEWDSGARRRLFEGLNAADGRHSTPPVDFEMSDESDDEHPHLHPNHDTHPAVSPPKKAQKAPSIKEQHQDSSSVVHWSPSPLPASTTQAQLANPRRRKRLQR